MTISDKAQWRTKYFYFPLAILVAWFFMAKYTFNEKPDLNGDNCYYYTVASAMATGHGYSNLAQPGAPATATYPPGYPILMTPLRMVTDSVVAQKWQNEIFVLLSLLLLYFTLMRLKLPMTISFAAAFTGAFLPRLLHFSTMMMSEAAFLLTGVLVMYFLVRMSENEDTWWSELKKPWLYLMVITLALNYQIRTQGLALLAGVMLCLLFRKRWASLGVTFVGFVLGYLPWSLRNKALGLSNTRYIDMVMVANPWRPEEGSITISEFIERFFDTVRMLVCQAIPNTIPPFFDFNPDQPEYTFYAYFVGAVLLALIAIGCWQMGKLRWAMLGYIAATIGIISVFSTPSGSRYLTSILPLLTAAEIIGIWAILMWGVKKFLKPSEQALPTWNAIVACCFLLLPFTAKPLLADEHKAAQQRYPLPYTQYFKIGKDLKANTPENTIVCCRKNELLHLYSDRPGVGYLFTSDPDELIRDLITKNVDYVILDALGYSSTPLYLGPAVQKHFRFFDIVEQFDDTHTYLLRFKRNEAADFFATN